jgi:hypothetical protein
LALFVSKENNKKYLKYKNIKNGEFAKMSSS